MIPIDGTTRLGIQFFEWTKRFVVRLSQEELDQGWAFRRPKGTRALAKDYRENIFSKLEILQKTTDLIDPDCKVWQDFGVQQSVRRWFTTECTRQGVDKNLVELQCRWSTDRDNGERTAQRSMIHTYSEVRNTKDVLVRPSKAL